MRTLLVALVGAALLVVGVVVLVTSARTSGPADYGWFAYTPLGDGDPHLFDEILLISSRRLVGGTATAALGLALLAGTAGFQAGRRSRSEVG